MCTVEQLMEMLSHCPKDMRIINQQGEDFIHMVNAGDGGSELLILSTEKPLGYCNRSGDYVYPSVISGYSAYSPALDEDLFTFEWTKFTKEDFKAKKE